MINPRLWLARIITFKHLQSYYLCKNMVLKKCTCLFVPFFVRKFSRGEHSDIQFVCVFTSLNVFIM